ncbi:ABC transporter permease [Sporanaerobium hydrogeniformans]|uniref:ABC transporter permease n=1 Tax=Sporanaerobium hydrogeniformans TaxID=3072179 RepID=A0AC61DE95_9FIRM|nr:sugar ABC transporter permease [Sporanaerobium hydrogeniformans]PHV71609.1 ABC transporter permease [Sporanaerobium hydrogeniformans]
MKRSRQHYCKRDYMGLVYILPWLLGLLLLQLYPFITSFYYSFTDYSFFNTPKLVGLKNYIRLFTIDPEFFNSLKVTLIYTLYTVPGKLIMALFIAVILNKNLKGINFIRTIYYLPSLFGGSVAVAILWKLLFMSDGAINNILQFLHLPTVEWLGNPDVALKTICLLEIWQFGSSMVMFLAALKQVPRSLYEAAQIDGAGKIKIFFKITIPQITPIIFFNLIMQTISALQNFTSAFVVTTGGPNKATYVLGMKLYTDAFSHYKMGYASATSWIIFILIMIITLLLFRFSSGWVYYEDGDDF